MKRSDFKSIDEYIGMFPDEVQVILEKMRRTIREVLPEGVEAISYQIPTFKLNGHNVVHFAGFKHHIGMYPVPAGNEAFTKKIAPYVKGKGTIQFQLGEPIPYDLVREIVKFLMENSRERYGKD